LQANKTTTHLKSLLSLFLALVIFLQPLGKLWIVASFELNQDYIAQTLCVERNEAENTCQGVCHLKKQLAEAEEQEKQQQSLLKKSLDLVYIVPSVSFELACLPALEACLPLPTPYLSMKAREYVCMMLRPPIC
jgi:hypothetical protein